MTALAQEKYNAPYALNSVFPTMPPVEYDMAANVTIYAGALVMLNASGNATPGATATGQIAAGVSEKTATNGATIGATKIGVRHGVFTFANSAAADEITKAHYGKDCYIVDDQTVAATDGSSARSRAGKVMGVTAAGVLVLICPGF